MSLSTNSKQQQQRPLFYKEEFDATDLKVRFDSNVRFAEVSLADLLISGYIRGEIVHISHVPMLIVSVTSKMLDKSPHLPQTMARLIPMNKIFNKEVMDLKTPKFSNLTVCQRTTLRLYLQWRLNTSSEIIGSPKSSLSTVILSGNNQHFGYEGAFWLKQVFPYQPEIKELLIDNNDINDADLLLIIEALSLRHDSEKMKSIYPIKLLERIDLSNNKFSDRHIDKLLQALLVYTPYLREIDLSYNGLTNKCCAAIGGYLDDMNDRAKKERCLRKIVLRHNQIDFEGVKQINASVKDCNASWNFKIELGSNPTKQLYTFDANQAVQVDHRINLHGA